MRFRGKDHAIGKALLRAAGKAQDSSPCIVGISALFQWSLRCMRSASLQIRLAAVLVIVSGLVACGGGGGGNEPKSPTAAPSPNPPVEQPEPPAPAETPPPANTPPATPPPNPPADAPPDSNEEPVEENPVSERRPESNEEPVEENPVSERRPESNEEPVEESPVSEEPPNGDETPAQPVDEPPAGDEDPHEAGFAVIAPDGGSSPPGDLVAIAQPDDSTLPLEPALSGQEATGDEQSLSAKGLSSSDPAPAEVWAQGCPALPAHYCNQWGLEMIKAGQAYAKLHTLPGSTEPGEGVVLGFIDLGLENNYGLDGVGIHHAFGDKDFTEYRPHGLEPNSGSRETDTHGTSVASVAAAVPLDETDSMQGVAPGATVVSLTSYGRHPISLDGYRAVTRGDLKFYQLEWLGLIDTAIRHGVDILNVSLGYTGIIDSYTKEDLEYGFNAVVHSMTQADTEEDKMLIVWAAGNANGKPCVAGNFCVNGRINASSVEVLPGLVARFEGLQSVMVAVVAIGEDGQIAPFSNRCGIAKANCIAAPGSNVRVAYFGDWPKDSQTPLFNRHNAYTDSDGTSFAAPMVTGGLALIMHRFRDQLPSEQVLTRLFETANDQGIYSNENIYGHGLMDLDAATEPIGEPTIITAPDVSLPGPPLRTTSLSLGTAFGSAPKRSLTGREIASFDSQGAPFWHDMGRLVGSRGDDLQQKLRALLERDISLDPSPSHPELGVRSFGQSIQLAFAVEEGQGFSGLAGPALAVSLSSADSPLIATAFTSEGTEGLTPATGLALNWKPLGLRMGLLAESSSSLGAVGSGGFGRLSSSTVFAGMERRGQAGPWTLEANAEIGAAMPSAGHGMLETLDTMKASRLALRASRRAGRLGLFRLSLEQPLRIETATASLLAPVGRAKNGSVLFDRWTTDLAPKGRQVDLGAGWTSPSHQSGRLSLRAVYSRHPGHDDNARPSLSLLAGYRLAF